LTNVVTMVGVDMAEAASGHGGAAGPGLDTLMHTGPFHLALRAAVRERGLTLERLRTDLARRGELIPLSTLTDWERGHRRPTAVTSLRTVLAIEEVLALQPRSLIRLLVQPRSRQHRPRGGIDEASGVIADLLDAIPGSRLHTFDVVSAHEKVAIDAERRVGSIWSRTVIRALRDGVDRWVLRYYGDPSCAIEHVEVQALENCYVGVVRRRAGVLVAEMRFGEALRVGETWALETQLTDGTGQPSTEHAHGFREPGQQYQVEVRFDPAALPVDCHSFARTGLHDPTRRTGDLALDERHAVRLMECRMAAGLVGIGWRWPEG
jgi:hypothetical protein